MLGRWTLVTRIVMVAAAVGVFATGGHLAATRLIESQHASQLNDLVQLALRRTEAAVDYGTAALKELGGRGVPGCSEVALQAVRLHVYQRGPVKDIRIADHSGAIRCSAYAETLEFDRQWPSRDEMLAAPEGVSLFRVDQFFGAALGVLKDIDADTSLIAILVIDTAPLDVMPTDLRRDSSVSVSLTDGRTIAELLTATPTIRNPEMTEVTAQSTRYPLRAVLRVENTALAGWNRDSYLPILLLSAGLGLAFGLLLARTLAREQPPSAVMDEALANDEFQPYLQPIFDLRTGEIVGCEMLARWIKPDGTVVPPLRFIGIAEDTGRIEALTWRLLKRALREMKPVMKRNKSFRLSVNISPRHFLSPFFAEDLRAAIAAAGIARRQIVLEITEREQLADLEAAAAVVHALQADGFLIAIDDVGIGHSGLSNLQKLRADILKIDKFFVDAIAADPSARSVVDMLVNLANQLGMSLVAEGIELREQVDILSRCGVASGQGYLVSPPVPVAEFIALLGRADNAGADRQPVVEQANVA